MSLVAAGGLVALLGSAALTYAPVDPGPDPCLYAECSPMPYEVGSWAPGQAVDGAVATTQSRARGSIAAGAALSMLGTPYAWGGGSAAGPTRGTAQGRNTVGFDCSGLALYAWAKAGVELGHYTGTQFRQGRKLKKSELQPGDLVFFGAPGAAPNHVGVHVGGGTMVHAPQTGDVVKKTDFMTSPYYSGRYRGAVRPGETADKSPGWVPPTGPDAVTIDPGGA